MVVTYVTEYLKGWIDILDKYDITDSELEIMQVLWKNGGGTLSEITAELDKIRKRNKNTVKTLIYRLIDKKAVKSKKGSAQGFVYSAAISEKKYLSKANHSFLARLYKGNVEKLLMNFVEEKTVSKEELQKLIKFIESEK